ncbi:MAG: 3D domain-containing protein [Phycisphaeraceae bacterium]
MRRKRILFRRGGSSLLGAVALTFVALFAGACVMGVADLPTAAAVDPVRPTIHAPASPAAPAMMRTGAEFDVHPQPIATTPEPATTEPEVTPEPAPAASPAETVRKAVSRPDGVRFDQRPLRKVREMSMVVTAYSPDERSCGKWADGITASGYSVWTNGMKLLAADTDVLPFGTILTVPGYNDGRPVQVLDRGGAIKGNRLDVLYPTHERARQWGRQRLTVTVWEYAD